MKTRTSVAIIAAGVALSAVAVTAVLGGTGTSVVGLLPGRPVAQTTAPSPASSTGAAGVPAKPPKGALPAATGVSELRTSGTKKPSIVLAPSGAIRTVTAQPSETLGKSGTDEFVGRYAGSFGLSDAYSLKKSETRQLPGGDTVTRYAQTAGGLPVLGGEVIVTSRGAAVRAAVAETTQQKPGGGAKLSEADAVAKAIPPAADKLQLDAAGLRAGETKLWLYDPALIGAPAGPTGARPTWSVSVTDENGGDVAQVLVDAVDGTVRLTINEREYANNRIICDLANRRVNLNTSANYLCTATSFLGLQSTTRTEGGAASSVADVNSVYTMIGKTEDFYRAKFGLDSFDGQGAQVRATVRACHTSGSCPYQNAYWEGTQFVFGQGFATDDVVAHEYTHGVTEHSAGLMYAYQSGAINEALSDIMGELIDQADNPSKSAADKWLMGETLPIGAIRSMKQPELYGQPSCYGCTYWETDPQLLDNGGVHTNSGPANYAAYLIATGMSGDGNAKSAQLWYRVQHLLPSGADYPLLGSTLASACSQLIGHYGVTLADCGVVANAITTTKMLDPTVDGGSFPTRIKFCPQSNQPLNTVYYEGFEKPGTWDVTNAPYWLTLPDPIAPYEYAYTGAGSLNGWTTTAGAGNGATATMKNAVTVPAGSTYLSLMAGALTRDSQGIPYLEYSVNGGAWTGAAFPVADGFAFGGGGAMPELDGYNATRLDISSLAGKSVKFRFRLQSVAPSAYRSGGLDFYVDDFRVYQCAARPSAPAGYAYLDGGTGTVGVTTVYGVGDAGGYSVSGDPVDHFEVQFTPPIPGAPTTFAPGSELTVTNAPPYNYTVLVRAVSGAGVPSDWTTLFMSTTGPTSCQTLTYSGGRPVCLPAGHTRR
ncbi:M4 family metallopeptidase [Hamadaea tsunoensis]|uniref:M4 family metallopeptidase n=1 Tax=Hamadaea tsunoensis TaxID=53368 RepID=UPI00048291FA|nr:M4 family metallopeptidase [Hamadaea tsunoensis]